MSNQSQNATPLIDLATSLKDTSARLTKNRENMRETFHGFEKVLGRLQWISEMENYFGSKGPKGDWDEQTKSDYRTFLANRGDDAILASMREHVNNLSFQYRGVIGSSNEIGRAAIKALDLAQPEFQTLSKRTVNVSGLSPDVTKPSPEEAAEAEEARDAREGLGDAPVAPNLAGPQL